MHASAGVARAKPEAIFPFAGDCFAPLAMTGTTTGGSMSKSDPNAPKRLALIASKGTLDWAYPPFILATAAGAMGWEAGIFFTFFGLTLLKTRLTAMVSPLGNPAMPMKMPFGPEGFQSINWPMPNLLMANIPGFETLATSLMKQTFKNKGVATVEELRDM